jgi:uncharacterized membrane protein YsdA (DUF1294 family)
MSQTEPSFFQIVSELASFIGAANIATGLVVINFVAFAAFGIDKAKAEAGQWRVQESTLLTFALLGGSPGAYAGRALFRHKTRKQPFNSQLQVIVFLQVLALGALIGWWLGD